MSQPTSYAPCRRHFFALVAALGLAAATPAAAAVAKVGDAAPAFTATDSNGKPLSLAQLRGKYVVLEWHNQDCPFVVKHYGSGNMQKLQREWMAKQVAWLTVISSAAGKQGSVDGKGANDDMLRSKATPSAVLLDPKGEVARLYAAKTTPQMYIIDPQGKLIYSGAIDDKPSSDPADIPSAKNYVSQALSEALAGKPVSQPQTVPYGCSVKY
jgi:peroxiredoxin